MNEIYNQPNFNPGAIEDKPDERDYQWSEIAGALPSFDWSKGYDVEEELADVLQSPGFQLKPNDQNGSGSCGGQAWSKYAAVLKAIFRKQFDERSAKFIYSQTFVPGGGSAGRDNCSVLIKQGCASELLCPSYENGQPPAEPFMERPDDITLAAKMNAKIDEALSYANVTINIDAFAQAIQNNHGAVIGIRGSNNGTWGSAFPKPPIDADPVKWGHWIYVGKAKLINGEKKIGFLNSWGPNVGDRGWQWIGEDYFATLLQGLGSAIFSGWTHVFNPNPTTTLKHNFVTDLVFGAQSDEVKALQQALQIDGEFPTNVPTAGFYGNITRQAVLSFQLKYQVAPLAELQALQGRSAGPATRGKLNQLFN